MPENLLQTGRMLSVKLKADAASRNLFPMQTACKRSPPSHCLLPSFYSTQVWYSCFCPWLIWQNGSIALHTSRTHCERPFSVRLQPIQEKEKIVDLQFWNADISKKLPLKAKSWKHWSVIHSTRNFNMEPKPTWIERASSTSWKKMLIFWRQIQEGARNSQKVLGHRGRVIQ